MLLIQIILLTAYILFLETKAFDIKNANISVYLSGAAYCEKNKYKTMKLAGTASEFTYYNTLYDITTDLNGYIGYLSSKKAIYVVLRGSSSMLNWLDDVEAKMINYTSCKDCKVHYGFYRSAKGIANKTIEAVRFLKKRFPLYSVVMTGHSYGAATVQLLAMELKKADIDIEVYSYGQPRTGNLNYSKFVNKMISKYWRFTHNRDIVPHVPPTTYLSYIHSCGEIFEDINGILNICSNTDCEDSMCSNKYTISQTNIEDHLYYLHRRINCENSVIKL